MKTFSRRPVLLCLMLLGGGVAFPPRASAAEAEPALPASVIEDSAAIRKKVADARADAEAMGMTISPDGRSFSGGTAPANVRVEITRIIGERSSVESTHALLFQWLDLGAERVEILKDLLVERNLAQREALAYLQASQVMFTLPPEFQMSPRPPGTITMASRTSGILEPGPERARQREVAGAPAEVEIEKLLGPEKFAAYKFFTASFGHRTLVINKLQERLSPLGLDLDAAQVEQLVEALVEANPEPVLDVGTNPLTIGVAKQAGYLDPFQQTVLLKFQRQSETNARAYTNTLNEERLKRGLPLPAPSAELPPNTTLETQSFAVNSRAREMLLRAQGGPPRGRGAPPQSDGPDLLDTQADATGCGRKSARLCERKGGSFRSLGILSGISESFFWKNRLRFWRPCPPSKTQLKPRMVRRSLRLEHGWGRINSEAMKPGTELERAEGRDPDH